MDTNNGDLNNYVYISNPKDKVKPVKQKQEINSIFLAFILIHALGPVGLIFVICRGTKRVKRFLLWFFLSVFVFIPLIGGIIYWIICLFQACFN